MQPHLLTGVVLAGFIVTTIFVLRRLLNGQSQPITADSSAESRIDFGPMARLLSDGDFEFLRSQPGFDPSLERQLRKRRAAVCRAYLASLAQEFERLHLTLRMLSLTASVDRPDLAGLLVREKVQFTVRLMFARMNVTAFAFGFQPTDLSHLVQAIDSMRNLAQSTQLAIAPVKA